VKEPHFITRCRERYGLELTKRDMTAISVMCDKSSPLEKGRNGTNIFYIVYGGVILLVVREAKKRGTLVTVLPKTAAASVLARMHESDKKARRRRGRWLQKFDRKFSKRSK